MTKTKERVLHVGESNLTGLRGAAGRAIAKPVANHTRFTQEQVEAAIGLALLAYAVYRLARPISRRSCRTRGPSWICSPLEEASHPISNPLEAGVRGRRLEGSIFEGVGDHGAWHPPSPPPRWPSPLPPTKRVLPRPRRLQARVVPRFPTRIPRRQRVTSVLQGSRSRPSRVCPTSDMGRPRYPTMGWSEMKKDEHRRVDETPEPITPPGDAPRPPDDEGTGPRHRVPPPPLDHLTPSSLRPPEFGRFMLRRLQRRVRPRGSTTP